MIKQSFFLNIFLALFKSLSFNFLQHIIHKVRLVLVSILSHLEILDFYASLDNNVLTLYLFWIMSADIKQRIFIINFLLDCRLKFHFKPFIEFGIGFFSKI